MEAFVYIIDKKIMTAERVKHIDLEKITGLSHKAFFINDYS